MMALAVTVLALSIGGCSDRLAGPVSADIERNSFLQRANILKAKVATTGQMTDAQRGELEALARDIGSWQARTGRADVGVRRSRPAMEAGVVSAMAAVGPGVISGCDPCPAVTVSGGRICFLAGGTLCGKPGDIITRYCWYTCIFDLGPPAPIRPR